MRELGTTPHVTQNLTRRGGSAIDGRTTRHEGYAKSQHGTAADRTRVWVAEDGRLDSQSEIAWACESGLVIRLRERRVQSDPVTEAVTATGKVNALSGRRLARD